MVCTPNPSERSDDAICYAQSFFACCVSPGLAAVWVSCATLATEGQVFSTRFEDRDPHDTILMRWIDRYWRL